MGQVLVLELISPVISSLKTFRFNFLVSRDLRGILEVDEARIEELNNLHQERFLLDPSRRINPSLQLWNLENSEVSIYPFHTIRRHNMDNSNKAQDILSLREEFKTKMDSNSQTEYQTASQEHNGGLSETNSKPEIKSQSPNKNQAHVEKQLKSFHSQNESQAEEESQTYLESQAANEFQPQSNSQAVNKSQTNLKSQADNGFQPKIESHHEEESQKYLESQADNEFQPHSNSQAVEKSLTYIESQADNGFQPQIESHHEEESQKYLESQADNEFQLQTKSQRDSESQESQEIDGLRTENKSQLDNKSQEINEVQSTHKSQQENGFQTKTGVHSQNNSNPHNCSQKQNGEELLHNDQGFVDNEKDLPHLNEKDLKPNVENFLHLGKLKSTVEVNGLCSELDTGIKLLSEHGDTTHP